MSLRFSKGVFIPKHPEKYLGKGTIFYRSSWELVMMRFCDNNPSIHQWASESIKIPYRDPLTGKNTIYVPDFLIIYEDRNHKKHAELVEVKPENQTVLEKVGKNPYNQAQYVKNKAKWTAAKIFCDHYGLKFRVITEHEIFSNTSRKR